MASPIRYQLTYDFTGFQSANPNTPLPADKIEIELTNIETSIGQTITNLGLIQRSDGALNNEIVTFDSLDQAMKALLGTTMVPRGNWAATTAYKKLDLVQVGNSTYIAVQDHNSGTSFTVDLVAGKWLLWVNPGFVDGTSYFQKFSGNGSQTAFTVSQDMGTDENGLMIFINNSGWIPQDPTSYTINGTTLTFNVAPVNGTNNIYVFAPAKILSQAATYAAAAGTSAAGAATSESNAASSASSASTSATNAANSATSASNSASAAATSASNAATSATNAANSATAAAGSATSASTAATNAASSSASASTSASNASTSATNAASSASTASTAATNAGNSATAAAASASSASTSATNAAASAADAAASAQEVITADAVGLNVKIYGAIGDGTSHPLSEFYPNLAAAQVDFPHATSLTNEIDWAAIQKAINTGVVKITLPEGEYWINQTLVLRSNLFMEGVSHGNYAGGTVIKRKADIIGLSATGISITVQPDPFALISRCVFDGIIFDGGDKFTAGDPDNGNAHYLQPMMDLKACYRFAWNNCHFTNCAGSWMRTQELWDSRVMNVEWSFGGSLDGTIPGLNMLSGASSPGYETTNNIYFYGNRWESSPGVLVSVDGNNGVDLWFEACKWESVHYQNDYLVKLIAATGVTFTDCWMYVTADVYKNLLWTATDSNTIGSSGTKSFTIQTGLTYNTSNFYNNKLFANMHVVMYDADNPNNWMTGRVASYNSGTGALTVTAEYSEGSGTITNWRIAPMHPGLMKMSNNCRLVKGNIIGGTNACANAPVDAPFMKTMVEIASSEGINLDIQLTAGSDRLPGATFKALHDTTTTTNVGYGQKTFTVETGQTIAVGTMLYIFGRPIANHSDWMVGRVESYNSGTGQLVVRVGRISFGGVPANNVTGWTMLRASQSMTIQTGTLLSGGLNRVRITGASQGYAYAYGTDASTSPEEHEQLRLMRHGSPTLFQRNKATEEDWYMGRITNDPTTVPNPDGLGGTVTGNTGQYQFALYDFARQIDYTIWHVDGSRNFVMRRPMLFKDKIWFIDPDTGSGYKQSSILGSAASFPTSGSVVYFQGDIILNSRVLNAGDPLGWVCVAGGTGGASTWRTFGAIDMIGGAIGFTGQKWFQEAALTDGASIAWNLNTQQAATVTLAGNRTLANPTNLKAGGSYTLIVKQDATGSRTLAYGSAYKWPGGVAPVLTTAANAVDVLTFLSDGTNMYGAIQKAFA